MSVEVFMHCDVCKQVAPKPVAVDSGWFEMHYSEAPLTFRGEPTRGTREDIHACGVDCRSKWLTDRANGEVVQ